MHIPENKVQMYSKKADVPLLKTLYLVLKSESDKRGIKYVTDNFVQIITENINQRVDFTLPTEHEVEYAYVFGDK